MLISRDCNENELIILLVEDDPEYASFIQLALQRSQDIAVTCERADTLSSAMQRLELQDVDVILLDLGLPDCSGSETLRKTREQAPDVPVIVLTGTEDDYISTSSIREGAQDYVVKSAVNVKALIKSIVYAVERNRAEKAAQENLLKIIESNADGILILDREAKVLFVNPAAEVIFGREASELVGTTFGYTLVGGETTEIEVIKKDGSVSIVEVRVVETDWQGEQVQLTSLRDITRHKELQESLEQAGREVRKTLVELEESKRIIEEQNRVLTDLAIKDGLTGLNNHRHMDAVVQKTVAYGKRYSLALSCMLLDLDFFKEVNDSCGHAMGDFVLKEFAQCLKQNIRTSDMAFRYGGEEFLVLLPNTRLRGANSLAEKLRAYFEAKTYDNGTYSVTVTVSIGVVSVKLNEKSRYEHILDCADKALYRAKAEGRNRVAVYQDHNSVTDREHINKNVDALKQKLASALEKTKRASLESVRLLARDWGDVYTREMEQSPMTHACLEHFADRLHLTPNIIETFKRASVLHDSFRVLINNELLKKPEPLSAEERIELENHPYVVAEMVDLFDFFSNEKQILLFHHEHYDGSGYPEGLKGEEIPLGARIFAIIDAFTAMNSDRPYRKSLSPEKVLAELVDNAGRQFDPALVRVFLDIVAEKDLLPLPPAAFSAARERLCADSGP